MMASNGTRRPQPQTQNRRPGGHQRPPGDFTGRKSEDLAKENADLVAQREEELGMLTGMRQRIRNEEVIDVSEPGRPELVDTGEAVDTDAREPIVIQKSEAPNPDGERLPSSTPTPLGAESSSVEIDELPEEGGLFAGGGGSREVLKDPAVLAKKVIFRALYDMEDVTIGYGNTYTFREGQRYRAPLWVAVHLQDKGLALILTGDLAGLPAAG